MGLTAPAIRRGFALAGLLLLAACSRKLPPSPPVPVEPPKLTLVAVGDILMHYDVKRAALEAGGFRALWADAEPLFRQGDVVFGNLETAVAPESGRPGRPYQFNAPADLLPALKQSGFTVLSIANNHAYDQGGKGLLETLQRVEAQGLIPIGSGRDAAQAEAPRILTIKGLKVAFLAWTDIFNANLNRDGRGPWVNGLEDNEDEAVAAIRKVRSMVDLVVVSVHWGNENQHKPTKRQHELAERFVEAGADLILGHHPHVLQPLESVEKGGHRGVVVFSLGNFISNQDRIYDPSRMSPAKGDCRDGAALVTIFVRATDGKMHLESARVEPLWTVNNWMAITRGQDKKRAIRVVRIAPQDSVLSVRRGRIQQVMERWELR